MLGSNLRRQKQLETESVVQEIRVISTKAKNDCSYWREGIFAVVIGIAGKKSRLQY